MKVFKSLYIFGLFFYFIVISAITLISFNLNLFFSKKTEPSKEKNIEIVHKVDTVFISEKDIPKPKEVTVDIPIIKKQTPVDTLKTNVKPQVVKPIDTLEKINNILDTTKIL